MQECSFHYAFIDMKECTLSQDWKRLHKSSAMRAAVPQVSLSLPARHLLVHMSSCVETQTANS